MNELRILRRLYWWSFALRFGVGVVALLSTQFLNIPFLQDALFYDEVARSVADDWLAGQSSAWLTTAMQSGTQAWVNVVFIACIYWLIGGLHVTPVVLAVYALFTSYTPVLVYRITRRLGGGPQAALFAGRLVAFSPCFAFWSGALYKEGIILVLLALGVLHTLRLQERMRPWSLIMVSTSVIVLYGLRFYMAVILGGALAYGLLMGRPRQRGAGVRVVTLARQAVIAGVFAILLVALGFTTRVQKTLPADLADVLVQIDASRADLARSGDSGYLVGSDVSTPDAAFEFLPIGIAYFVTVPLPWQIGSTRQNLTIPETAIWVLALYPLAWLGLVRALRQNFQGSSLLLLMSVSICVFYALLVGNAGTAYRLRIQVWMLVSVFAGLGWEEWKKRRWERRAASALPQRHRREIAA